MTERPILFSGPMVRAILEGRKSQTRRIVKPQPVEQGGILYIDGKSSAILRAPPFKSQPSTPYYDTQAEDNSAAYCPYGAPGDRLWVRETWGSKEADRPGVPDGRKPQQGDRLAYMANSADDWQWRDGSLPWRPSIHMPRWACRLVLEVAGVRVERLQEISASDAKAEGIEPHGKNSWWGGRMEGTGKVMHANPERAYAELWDSINAKRAPWASNPWVWVIEFKRKP